MEKLQTIKTVKAEAPTRLHIQWDNDLSVTVDLRDVLRKKPFTALKDARVFVAAQLGDWGHSVVWPGNIELGADSLWRMTLLATDRADSVEFMDWRLRHGLSLSAAAEALGLSRRMIAYYSSGEKTVPRTVLLACRGWEATLAA